MMSSPTDKMLMTSFSQIGYVPPQKKEYNPDEEKKNKAYLKSVMKRVVNDQCPKDLIESFKDIGRI